MGEPFVCETGLVVESGCKVAVGAAANGGFVGTVRLRNPTEHALSYRLKVARPVVGLQARHASGCLAPGHAVHVELMLSSAALDAAQLYFRVCRGDQPEQKVPIALSRADAPLALTDRRASASGDALACLLPSPLPSPLPPSLVLSPLTSTPSAASTCRQRVRPADARSSRSGEAAASPSQTPTVGDERWLRETVGELLEEMARVCRSTDVRLTAATAPSEGGDGDAFTELLWRQVEKRLNGGGVPLPDAHSKPLNLSVVSEQSFDV